MNKAGMYTSEFWISLAVLIACTFALAIDKLDSDTWAMMVSGIAGVYTIGRSVTKLNGKNRNGGE